MPPPGRRRLSSLTSILSLLFLFTYTASAASAVLGIDLGTEYIKAALVKPGIPLEIVLTKDSKRKESAAVAFKPSKSSPQTKVFPERIYGGDALALSARFPGDVYPNLKPLLSQQFQGNDLVSQYKSRFPNLRLVASSERETVGFKSSGFEDTEESFLVEELLAMELKNIRASAMIMAGKGSTIRDVVITVPPFYTAEEKRAVIMAAELAGLRVLSLISDGLAVGLNYATSRTFPTISDGGKPEVHLVYDMGAGSTSATILRFQGRTVKDIGKYNKTVQEVQIVGTAWNKTLGGDTLNQLIIDDMVQKLSSTSKVKALGASVENIKQHGRTMAKLWKESERLRQVLSANTETQASFEGLYHEDVNFKYKLTRTNFEELATQYATQVTSPVTLALESAKLSLTDIESVILHGGAVRTPFVQKQLEEMVGNTDKIRTNVNSDEAAVFGAAFKGATISPSFRVKEIRTFDTPGYASGATWTVDGKERQQKLFTPTSVIGAEKQVAFKLLEDFTFQLYQSVPSPSGDMPISEIQTKNLSASVKQLEDGFGCTASDISTKFAIRLSPSDGLPEVVRGTVSCEATGKKGSVVDGVKDLFGFGSKKGDQKADQKPLAEGSKDESDKSSSTFSGTETSTTSPKESTTPDSTASDKIQDDTNKKASEPKTRTETIAIDFTTTPAGLPQLPPSSLQRIKDRLAAFDASDRSRLKREETLNTLEAFTYKARDLLSDDAFISVSTSAQRSTIEEQFQTASEWLYGDGADASRELLKERLDELHGLVDPVLARKEEAAKRPDAVKSLKEALDQVKVMVDVVTQQQEAQKIKEEQEAASSSSASEASSSSTSATDTATTTTSSTEADPFADLDDSPYSSTSTTTTTSSSSSTSTPPSPPPYTYTPADLSSLLSTRDDVQSWLDAKLASQASLSPSDDPAVSVKDLEAKSKELNNVVMELLQKQMGRSPPPKGSGSGKAKAKPGGKKGAAAKGGKAAKESKKMDLDMEELFKDMPASEREEIERAMRGMEKEQGKEKEKKADVKHEEL
ncbi:MAG: hypothetical protein Q9220_000845 [cf. Caloplaca sp. 1 TL-2023]